MSNTPLKTKISSFILDILFPKICVVCSKEGALICAPCIQFLEPLPFSLCPSCSKKTIEGKIDISCRNDGIRISRFFTALPYKNTYVKTLIWQSKYPPHYAKELLKDAASILIRFLVLQKFDALTSSPKEAHKIVLVPVPLHYKKLRSRSFNQAEIIAEAISSQFSIPIAINTLIRNRETKSQTKMKPLKRTINILDAFTVNAPSTIKGKTIILVDDVYTSGSTINECARVLLKAGVKTVWGITLAR